MSKKAYEVISPLQRDGRRYEIGATIQLTDDEAAPLLAHTIREVAVEQNAADFLGRGKKK